jgi:hypothetical protein
MPPLCEFCETAVDLHLGQEFEEGQRIDLPFHHNVAAFLESGKRCPLCALILQEDQCLQTEGPTFQSLLESNNEDVGFKFSMLKAANGFSRFWPTCANSDGESKEPLNNPQHETAGWMTSTQGKNCFCCAATYNVYS